VPFYELISVVCSLPHIASPRFRSRGAGDLQTALCPGVRFYLSRDRAFCVVRAIAEPRIVSYPILLIRPFPFQGRGLEGVVLVRHVNSWDWLGPVPGFHSVFILNRDHGPHAALMPLRVAHPWPPPVGPSW